jgi:hypothetical protein
MSGRLAKRFFHAAVAQQRDVGRSRFRLFGPEHPPHCGLDSQRFKKAGRHLEAGHALRLIAAFENHAARGEGRHVFKAPAMRFPFFEIRIRGDVVRPVGARRPDQDEILRLGKRQGTQEHGVDDAEDRRVGADAEGQGQHRDGGEAGIFPQHANAETQIPREVLQHGQAAAVPHLLLDRFDAAELEQRVPARRFGRHACPQVVFHMEGEMALQLFGELAVPALAVELSAQ